MRGILPIGCALALLGCGKAGGQSFHDGVDLICRADVESSAVHAHPADRGRIVSEWLAPRLKNARARTLLVDMGKTADGGVAVLRAAAREVGLDRCEHLAQGHLPEDPWGELRVPRLPTSMRIEPAPATGSLVTITSSAVAADGASRVALVDGRPAGGHADDGEALIPEVQAWATAHDGAGTTDATWVRIAAAPEVPAATLASVVASLRSPARQLALVVERDDDGTGEPIGVIPLASSPAADPLADPPPLQMFVAITPDQVIVASLLGQEGTMAAPLMRTARDPAGDWLSRVRTILGEVAKRRWAGKTRPEAERRVMILVAPALTVGDAAPLLAAVRYDGDGRDELFPEVVLASGLPRGGGGAAAGDRQPGTDLAAPVAAAGDAGAGAAAATPRPRVRVSRGTIAEVATSLGIDTIIAKVESTYAAGLKRCYVEALKVDPTATADLELTLTVNESGRSVEPSVTGGPDTVDDCVTAMAAHWTFPAPKNADGEPASTTVMLRIALYADAP
ncbi:MAG: hypothetical protein H6709_12170 [Kofleriaceae bacterium]|nr:hypothetical protein [Kofleriaceae bacterium]